MVHILDEPVEVVRRAGAPDQFLLRSRLYVVRAVLAHWLEPGGWRWAAPRPAAWVGRLAGDLGGPVGESGDRPVAGPDPGGAGSGAAGDGPPAGGALATAVRAETPDRELWRVRAAAGRGDRPRVFDLCLSGEQPAWTASRLEE